MRKTKLPFNLPAVLERVQPKSAPNQGGNDYVLDRDHVLVHKAKRHDNKNPINENNMKNLKPEISASRTEWE